MKVPIYTMRDLYKSDEHSFSEYHDFLELVIDRELYENQIEEGVTKKAISDGTQILSEKQIFHLQNILNRYIKDCNICGNQLELNEVVDGAYYCSYHQKYLDED